MDIEVEGQSVREKTVYFPGLNGIRAIAALAVVISHTTQRLADFGLNPRIFGTFKDGTPRGLDLGGFGVTIFFTLSGFLITYLLLLEAKKTTINIRYFYIRRILRIWPLYYLYLAVSLVVILIFDKEWSLKSLGFYVFYAANIPFMLGTALPFLEHYWSLGVEEQYYLVWPWFVKKCGERLIQITLALTTILVGAKCSIHFLWPSTVWDSILIVTRFQCMLIGGVGAMLFFRHDSYFLWLMTRKVVQYTAWIAVLFVALNRFHIASILDQEIIALLTLPLIIGQITGTNTPFSLERDFLDTLGKISYGLYIIHPLVLFALKQTLGGLSLNSALKYIVVYGASLGATIFLAYLSYEKFEKRFLILKREFSAVQSSSSKVGIADSAPAEG